MKSPLTFFALLVSVTMLYAQPKPAVKPATPQAPAGAKPKTQNPYVSRKDFDEMMAGMKSQVNSAVAANANLKHIINDKDKQVNMLDSQLQKVEGILNSASFKIAMTSDSLNQTRFSVEEFKKSNETHFTQVEESASKAMMILWGVLGLAIVFPVIVLLLLIKKTSNLKNYLMTQTAVMEAKVSKSIAAGEAKVAVGLESSKDHVRSEIASLQNYTDRWLSATKNDLAALKSEIEKLTSEIEELKNRS